MTALLAVLCGSFAVSFISFDIYIVVFTPSS